MFKRKARELFPLLATILIIPVIFYPAWRYPFFQDDFFALATTRIKSFTDIWGLFMPVAEAVYWRPLGIQLYFGLMQFAGLGNPLWFHSVSLAVHWWNTYLVYRLTLKIFSRRKIAGLTAFFWGASPIHYFALGWAVNFSFILVVTWVISAVLAFLEGKKFRAILFLILGLMTNEIAVVIPGLAALASWWLVKGKEFQRRRLGLTAVMSVLLAVYLAWRLTSGIKAQGDYSLSFWAPLTALRWYGLWVLGWSDIVRDNLTGWFWWRFEFVESFWWVVWPYVLELGLLGWLLIREIKRRHGLEIYKFYLWCGMWWMAGLMPVLFFSKHLYSHYAAIASMGVYWWIGKSLVNRRRLSVIITIVWLVAVGATMRLNYLASWMSDHARHSVMYREKLLQGKDEVGQDFRIYIVSSGDKAKIVLAYGYGIEYLLGIDYKQVVFVRSLDAVPELRRPEFLDALVTGRTRQDWLREQKIAIFSM